MNRLLTSLAVVGLLAFVFTSSANAQGHHGNRSHSQVNRFAYSNGHGFNSGGHVINSGYGNFGNQIGHRGNQHGFNGNAGYGHGSYGAGYLAAPSLGHQTRVPGIGHGSYGRGYNSFGHGGGLQIQTSGFGLRIGH